MVDILFIAIVSITCGATDFEDMEDTGYVKREWFEQYIKLPNCIPDTDTFRGVFKRLGSQKLFNVLQSFKSASGKVVAIDGSTICVSSMGSITLIV